MLNLTSSDLWANGVMFEDSVSGDNSFDIGSAIINVLTLSINNFDGRYSDYDFDGAEVVCYIGLALDDGTTEKVRICTVTVVEQPEVETVTIDLTCEDNMRKFDRDYSESKLIYPATRAQIIRDACSVCGVTLLTTSFDRDDYVVQQRPADDALTFRQVLQWVAQIGCQWLRCDEYGRLCVKWFDTGKTNPQEINVTYNFTPKHTDVVITGVKVTEYSDSSEDVAGSYISGTEGYVLGISDNKLIRKGDGETVASIIAEKCVGMVFRPFESQCPTDIALEAGDTITIEDRNGKLYNTYLTTTTLLPGSGQTIACNAKSAAKNSSTRYSQATQTYVDAWNLVEKEKSEREKAIKNLQESLSVGSGLFATYVQQEDGSTISYFHDKATLKESKNVIKITSEAIGVSNDGGKTYPFGFELTGTMITKLLYAEGINADYIDTGALTVKDKDGDIIFQVNMDTNTVYMNPDILIIGNQTLTEKLIAMDNSIAEAKNMTMQLTNDYQSITTDADGNISGTFPTVTTTAQVMYGTNDVTNDCTYTVTKSNNVTGSWNDSTHTYTVTGLSADNGWVDIKATYLRALSITKRFTVAKLKAGKNGINGLDGLQGEKGEQGIPGKDGKDGTNGVDGKTSYFHIKYSSVASPTSSSQMTETPSTYIGTYVDYEPNDSTDPKKYTWSKFEGTDGKDGIAGTNGTDGKTYYLHIAYANSADGRTGFSISDGTNKLYIGQYTDTTKADSTDPTKYTWSKIKGEPGADGKPGRTYIIEPSCTVLKRGADKVISPNFLEFNAYYRDGDSATRYAYSGRFVIEETADGSTWKTIYTSSTNETSVKHYLYTILTDGSGQTITDGNGTTVGIPRDITNIRCKLYAAGGTTDMLDMQSVAVVIDVDNLTQTDIVNILSNNGAWKGLYYKNGQLYISFSAALGGELALGGANNGNGILAVYNESGNISYKLTSNGNVFYNETGQCTAALVDGKMLFPDTPFTVTTGQWSSTQKGFIYGSKGLNRFSGRVYGNADGTVKFDYTTESFDGYYEPIFLEDDEINGFFDVLKATNYLTTKELMGLPDSDGIVRVKVTSAMDISKTLRLYNLTHVSSGGHLVLSQDGATVAYLSSSSERYKDVQKNLECMEQWYDIEPVWAKYKDGYLADDDIFNGKNMPMFLAEDVEKHMPEAAVYKDGEIEDWNYRVMIPAMFTMLKQQKSEIDSLKQELDEIKQLLRKE